MREAYMISTDALHSKTLKEYSGDLKHFINWFEAVTNTPQNNQIIFRPEDVAATILTQYRAT